MKQLVTCRVRRYGNQLVDACREIKTLGRDIDELALTIEGIWLKSKVQVSLLKRLWGSGALSDPTLQEHYADAIQHLYHKIYSAVDGLNQSNNRYLSATKHRQKAKALFLTRHLKGVVNELEKWQRRFDPSWYLITLLSTPKVDKGLKEQGNNASSARIVQIRSAIRDVSLQRSDPLDSIFKPNESVDSDRYRIPGTNSFTTRYNDYQVILDRTNYGGKFSAQAIKAQVRDSARMLMHVDPASFGLLKCLGAVESQGNQSESAHVPQFDFILEIPDGLDSPKTLRDQLLDKERPSLTVIMQLAKQLTRSVMFVHTTGFVHKGIRPETVLVFRKDQNELAASFLTGFERIRQAVGQTDRMEDLEWKRNLYRHPVRQGQWPEETYVMQHDIYSLGVCLLEIALWHSFVCLEADSTPKPWEDLKIQDALSDKDARRGGFCIKHELVALTKDRLPSLVGDQYTQLVLACLCCLDQDSEDNYFNMPDSGVTDRDGIVVGVRFIENVMLAFSPPILSKLTSYRRFSSKPRNYLFEYTAINYQNIWV